MQRNCRHTRGQRGAASAAWIMFSAALLQAAPGQACVKRTCQDSADVRTCIAVAAPAQEDGELWSHPVARTDTPPERLVLTGTRKGGLFMPASVAVPESSSDRPEMPAPLPVQENLLSTVEVGALGIGARVNVPGNAGAAAIHCSAGERPAGAAFHSNALRYPCAMRGEFVVEGTASPGFSVAVVPAGGDAPERPAGPSSRERALACPTGDAVASVPAIRIEPSGAAVQSGIGTWLWDAAAWLEHPESLAALAHRERVARLFLQVRITGGQVTDPGRLRRLIDVLSAAGVTTHAVEGDAEMATDGGRAHALERARILRRFLESGAALESIQYDIEPYLMPAHAADPAAGWLGWATTIDELSRVLGRNIPVVVPFWMLDDAAGRGALRLVESSISRITVMAYRTDVRQVERIAERWLSWGVERGMPVEIALENGPLQAEIHRTFMRAERGNVAVDRSRNSHLVRLFAAEVGTSDTQAAYAFSHEVEVPPLQISFLNDRAALASATERLTLTLAAWSSFAGFSVHGLIASGG
jgi:hypothetical protein